MDQVFVVARELQQSPDLLPWIVFIVVCCVLWKERSTIKDYFVARTEYWKSRKDTYVMLPELIRNNTEVMTKCMEAFKQWQGDRGESRRLLEYHEKSSCERIQHVQEVINRIDKTVTDNSRQIGLIEDRTDK